MDPNLALGITVDNRQFQSPSDRGYLWIGPHGPEPREFRAFQSPSDRGYLWIGRVSYPANPLPRFSPLQIGAIYGSPAVIAVL